MVSADIVYSRVYYSNYCNRSVYYIEVPRMDTKDYLGYIAHFHRNINSIVPRGDYVKLLTKELGNDIYKAPLPKVRETARHFYKAYVLGIYSRYSSFYLASKLNSKQIEDMLKDTIALGEKYGVFYTTIDYDLSPKVMDENILKQSLNNYRVVLDGIFAVKGKPKVAKGKAAGKKTMAITTSGTTRAANSTAAKRVPKVGKGKTVGKKTTVAKKQPVKTITIQQVQLCSDYTLSDLKQMAKPRGIKGRTKAQLCQALGLI